LFCWRSCPFFPFYCAPFFSRMLTDVSCRRLIPVAKPSKPGFFVPCAFLGFAAPHPGWAPSGSGSGPIYLSPLPQQNLFFEVLVCFLFLEMCKLTDIGDCVSAITLLPCLSPFACWLFMVKGCLFLPNLVSRAVPSHFRCFPLFCPDP